MQGGSRKVLRARGRMVFRSAMVASAVLACNVVHAATNSAVWTGANSTDFEDTGNWTSGTGTKGTGSTGTVIPMAPAPENSADVAGASGDIALFSTNPTTVNNPNVTATRSIQGLLFSTATGGWTLSGTPGSTLTIGGNGISTVGQSSGTDTVSATLSLSQTESLLAGSGGTLSLLGSINVGASGGPLTTQIIAGNGTTGGGTVVLDPGTSTDNFYTNEGAAGVGTASLVAAGGSLILGQPDTQVSSANTLVNSSGTFNVGLATSSATARIQIGGGIWEASDIGSTNNNAFNTGTLEVSAGTLALGGARGVLNYSAIQGGRVVVDGGSFIETGDGSGSDNALEIGNTAATQTASRTASFDVTSGLVDIAKSANASQIGNTGGSGALYTSALINQDGGVVQFGVTAAKNVFTGSTAGLSAGTNSLVIGSGKANSLAAYTLTGGKLLVNGIISGTAPGMNEVNNFNFMGGQLSVATFTATNLTSNSAATFSGSGTSSSGSGQASSGLNPGVLENYGGTIAPGDIGISGKTIITGSYFGNGNGSTMAFDIGGMNPATAFQTPSTYDLISISVAATLNDKLAVTVIPGFSPGSGTTFTILTTGTGISGAFSNLAFGSVGTTTDGSYSFIVNEAGNNVTLTNFAAVPEPTGMGVIAAGATMLVRRRRAKHSLERA